MSTHVCLVSRQPLPNLLGVLALRPERVVFLTTDAEDGVRQRLDAWLKRKGIATDFVRVDPYDVNAVRHACAAALAKPISSPVVLNATGGTKVAALGAVAHFQQQGAEVFYVNTAEQHIQWLVPADRPPQALKAPLSIEDYLTVHGFAVVREDNVPNPESRRELSTLLAREAVRGEQAMSYLRAVHFEVDANGRSMSEALARCTERQPSDPGPAQLAILKGLEQAGMIRWDGKKIVSIRSKDDLQYAGGRWLEEYTYLTLRGLNLDDVRANVVVRWGDRGTPKEVVNELDVVAVHRCRLYIFSCKTGAAVASRRKDYLAQDEVFKVETLRDLAGGTFARAVLVAGSKMTDQIKARCGRVGIEYVDGGDLHRLREHARRIMGV